MSIFRKEDVDLIENNVEDIIKRAEDLKNTTVEPTLKKKWDIILTVRDYVVKHKRKIYGGFALNALIKHVSPEDAFYDECDIDSWDIDFYSPDPIGDAKAIADLLHEKGYQHISATEAQHAETYKVFCETLDCADISYVPRQIYNRIPYDIVDDMWLTGTQFMMIDYFRIMTDFVSYEQRLEKSLKRFALMDKYYPLPHTTSEFGIMPAEDDLDVAFRIVHRFIESKDSLIVTGMYALNHLIKESKIQSRKLKGGRNGRNDGNNNRDTMKKKRRTNKSGDTFIKMTPINYYEIISTNYKNDAKELINTLQETFQTGNMVSYVEHYPFFQFLGYSVNIMYDDEIICKIYQYNNRCTPFHTVKSHYFLDGTYDKGEGEINIGSYETLMMYGLINIMRARTIKEKHTVNTYYTFISQMTEMRNWYLTTNNKTIYDEGLFQSFVISCKGEVESARMEMMKRRARLYKQKKYYALRYRPEDNKVDNHIYRFKNTSGNPIKNEKNFQIKFGTEVDLEDVEDSYEKERTSVSGDNDNNNNLGRTNESDLETTDDLYNAIMIEDNL